MPRKNIKPTHKRVLQVIRYNPNTGKFYWKFRVNSKIRRIGQEAGFIGKIGYVIIGIDDCELSGHKLAWFYVHKKWPKQIDHKNGIKSDNRLKNLREATTSQNGINKKRPRRDNKTGFIGIFFDPKRNKSWLATVGKFYCGRHETIEEALLARNKKGEQIYGDFFNHQFISDRQENICT